MSTCCTCVSDPEITCVVHPAPTIFTVRQLRFDCQKCAGRLIPDVSVDASSDIGFSVPTLTCDSCGYVARNAEGTEDLLGL